MGSLKCFALFIATLIVLDSGAVSAQIARNPGSGNLHRPEDPGMIKYFCETSQSGSLSCSFQFVGIVKLTELNPQLLENVEQAFNDAYAIDRQCQLAEARSRIEKGEIDQTSIYAREAERQNRALEIAELVLGARQLEDGKEAARQMLEFCASRDQELKSVLVERSKSIMSKTCKISIRSRSVSFTSTSDHSWEGVYSPDAACGGQVYRLEQQGGYSGHWILTISNRIPAEGNEERPAYCPKADAPALVFYQGDFARDFGCQLFQ